MNVVESPLHQPSRRLLLTPLRYPGGKGALYTTLRDLVRANDLSSGTYVEPYAGGVGAGLALLITGVVKRIVVNDLDPALYAFWRSVVKDPEGFAKQVAEVELSVREWRKQKEIYRSADRRDYLPLGFATFYLNRTNHSGVLNAGPIGGLDQTGSYKIDARFNRAALLERLRLIALHASQIVVLRHDGRKVIKRYTAMQDTIVYADLPYFQKAAALALIIGGLVLEFWASGYFQKAGTLYMNSFTDEDHRDLARCLADAQSGRWLLTYDDVDEVESLYRQFRRERFSLSYSAHRVTRGKELMVYSHGLRVPWSEHVGII